MFNLHYLLDNWISLSALVVSFTNAIITWKSNRIRIQPTFSWYKSTNDHSLKLRIRLTNLSSKTTMLTSFTLIDKNKTVIQDNGYNFDDAQEAEERAEADKRKKQHEQQLAKIRKNIHDSVKNSPLDPKTMRSLGLTDDDKNPAVMREVSRFNSDELHRQLESVTKVKTLTVRGFGNQDQSESVNFDEPAPLFGNGNLEFSYWLNPETIPTKLKISTTKTIFGIRRTKSFVIPKMANNQDENNDVHNQDDDLN